MLRLYNLDFSVCPNVKICLPVLNFTFALRKKMFFYLFLNFSKVDNSFFINVFQIILKIYRNENCLTPICGAGFIKMLYIKNKTYGKKKIFQCKTLYFKVP